VKKEVRERVKARYRLKEVNDKEKKVMAKSPRLHNERWRNRG